jgi:hypothetical protein
VWHLLVSNKRRIKPPLRPGAERVGVRWGRCHRRCAFGRTYRHDYRVSQFWNNEVIINIGGVLQVVLRALEGAPTSP